MPARLLLEWQEYAAIEPFGEERQDWHFAKLEALIANTNRDRKKRSKPYEPKDFLLAFGSPEPARKKTWQEMKAIVLLFADAQNRQAK